MTQNTLSSDDILAVLATVSDPVTGVSLASEGQIQSYVLKDGLLTLTLTIPREQAEILSPLCPSASRQLETLSGIQKANIILTAHRKTPLHVQNKASSPPLLSHVKTIIAIASGKGGVGKSTTAVHLAVGFGLAGLKTGLMDADIYGPSLHRMLGIQSKPKVVEGKIQPIDKWGIKAISLGMMIHEKDAMIWRGPMVMGAINQLLRDVDWGMLDVLFIDLPPGTGDAQLSIIQKTHLTGAIIVSTPQDIALIDVRRAVSLFEKASIPIIGLIENMSYFCCPHCGNKTDIFGYTGARQEAEAIGIPFLGEIPLFADIRTSGDKGIPLLLDTPHSESTRSWQHIICTLIQSLRLPTHNETSH